MCLSNIIWFVKFENGIFAALHYQQYKSATQQKLNLPLLPGSKNIRLIFESYFFVYPGPFKNLPGVAPECSLFFKTCAPFTNTSETPVAYWCGILKVA